MLRSKEPKQLELGTSLPTHDLPWWFSGKESACNAGDAGDRSSIPGSGRFPGFFKGIFPTQGLNLCRLHWQVDSLHQSHLGSPVTFSTRKLPI